MADETKKDPEIEKLEKELSRLELLAKIEEQKKKLEPPDSDLAAAEKRAKEAEFAAKTAEQEAKAFKANLPETSATALEGNITLDDKVVIETEKLAHASLAVVATTISSEVKAFYAAATPKPSIFIYNDTDIGALTAFRAYTGQMKILGEQFDDVAKTPPPVPLFGVAAIPAATATIKSLIDLTALFRTNTSIQGVTVSLDEIALASEVAGRLADTHPVYISKLYPLEAVPSKTLAGVQIQATLADVRSRATLAEQRVNVLPAGNDNDAAGKAEKKLKADQQARLTELKTVFNAYEAALSKPAEQGVSTLGTLLRGESLHALMKDGAVLYLKILKSGGSNRVRRSLWSSKLTHSGGAIANFILFKTDGSIAKSKTVADYSGYQEVVR